jgi:filamentous hemagglutinin family protein
MMLIRRHAIAFSVLPLLGASLSPLQAQITTDGSLGPQIELSGPEMTIGAELGQSRGGNLFHSFQRFGIPTNHSATFTGPDQIQNVIGRVTGGEVSNIDGQLRSTVGQADVYLINPAGVVMGPNASVDVPASLHVSTADELRFADGSRFSARDPGGSTLTLAAPEAFGFLGQQPPGDLRLNGARLEVSEAKTLGLSAGDITINQAAELSATSGHVQAIAVGHVNTAVKINDGSSAVAGGDLQIVDSSTIKVSGQVNSSPNAEAVTLRAGKLMIAGSQIAVDHHSQEISQEMSAGTVLLAAKKIDVLDSNIDARVHGSGRGSDIAVSAETVLIDATNERTRVSTRLLHGATGQAGDITVEADRLTLAHGGQLSAVVERVQPAERAAKCLIG